MYESFHFITHQTIQWPFVSCIEISTFTNVLLFIYSAISFNLSSLCGWTVHRVPRGPLMGLLYHREKKKVGVTSFWDIWSVSIHPSISQLAFSVHGHTVKGHFHLILSKRQRAHHDQTQCVWTIHIHTGCMLNAIKNIMAYEEKSICSECLKMRMSTEKVNRLLVSEANTCAMMQKILKYL